MQVKFAKSDRDGKKMKAVFYDGDKKVKTTHFGLDTGSTYIDHKDEDKKKAYIARHSKNNENWNDYQTAGSLSRYILWNKTSLKDSINDYKKKFNLN
tara:strand:+ start:10953 stop:11243 length:291 start_codon:yes stop_codon:yes gene_type:complete